MNRNVKTLTSTMLVLALVASFFAAMPLANAANSNGNNKNGATFTPRTNVGTIPWDYIRAHEVFDAAFAEGRVPDLPGRRLDIPKNSHIQLGGDTVCFYGYYTGRYSDYVYYKESDATEKTFKFNALFSIYQDNGIPLPQRWHSLRSVGFLVNCIDNDDEIVSGFYFSFEPKTGYNTAVGGASQIVVRFLYNMNFNNLREQSNLITNAKVLTKIDLENAAQTDEYEITSSNQAFSVMKNKEEIFSIDISNIDNPQISSIGEISGEDFQVPDGYTGGNDFGFFAAYMGSQDGHTCSELSFAEFSNIELWTRSLVPDISEVSWNNGNGNGNGNGINQLIVNGITLKSSKNYVEPVSFDAAIAKTTLAKNDPTAIYTVIDQTVNNGGQYEKVYDIKIGLFENGAWKVYSGQLSVDNPGKNEVVNQ